ncbi:MAG: monooxygenase [Bradymonadaceae bacterium]|nr:monooxygenase [Lujinxingiaceae bacterium]
MRIKIAVACVVLLLAGCSANENPGTNLPDTSPDTDKEIDRSDASGSDAALNEDATFDPDVVARTYGFHEDIKPIIDARCTSCHFYGGVGPFALTSYAEVASIGLLLKASVQARQMPPWLAGKDCAEYKHDVSLTDEQITAISSWVDQGMPEGDASNGGSGLPPHGGGLTRVDLTLEMPVTYEPKLKPDEYRCFAVDWPEQTTKYVTGFNVIAGNAQIVHHVIAYGIPPSYVAEVDALEAADGEPGYSCFGSAGVGDDANFAATERVGWLGSWAPGGKGADLPPGTGIRVEPGSKVVLQIHYNVVGSAAQSDRSAIQLKLEDSVEKAAIFMPWANPGWVNNSQPMLLEAGDSDASHQFGFDIASLVGRPVTIYSASLHMHMLGTKGRLWLDRAGDDDVCLLDVPRWDFGWQFGYLFDQPKRMQAGDKLMLKCHWDNSAANQPMVDGVRREAQDVVWGDRTTDEMCLGIFLVSFGD